MQKKKKYVWIPIAIIVFIAIGISAIFMMNISDMHKNYISLGNLSLEHLKKGLSNHTLKESSSKIDKMFHSSLNLDREAPVITLLGDEEIKWNVKTAFVDPGFTALDNIDGDLTAAVKVSGTVDINTYGTYSLEYEVSDMMGNIGKVKRTVIVGDFAAPTITLLGEGRIYVKVGETYVEPGVSVLDNVDGDISSKISISGGVDTSKMGKFSITYTVTDAAGNTATAARSVYVYEKQAVSNPVNPGNKVVYLTFDDGPSAHTARLLEILDKYGVKATFFVTNQFPAYQNMIGESHRRGHTIALHTYSHAYQNIYSSEEAYFQDLSLIHNICVAQTGVIPTILRFPGGTNNTVSKKYCTGIMTLLAQNISYHGYLYCDWNVSSGDAGGAKTAAQVASNVISGIQRNNVSVVLQHDIKSYSVEAVDEIVFWGIQNGYTFLPLTDSSPMVHYAPQN